MEDRMFGDQTINPLFGCLLERVHSLERGEQAHVDVDDASAVMRHQLGRKDPVKGESKQVELRLDAQAVDLLIEGGPVACVEPVKWDPTGRAEFIQITRRSGLGYDERGFDPEAFGLTRGRPEQMAVA